MRPHFSVGIHEHRLIRRDASDFGYEDESQARLDTRSLARQAQQQQQSNLDAQRAQQQTVTDLNAFEADRKAFADQNGVDYTPTNYSRTAGTADIGTGVSGTKLDANGNPVLVYNSPDRLVMDRSLQGSMVGDRNGLGEIDQSALQRLMSSGMSYDQAVKTIQGNRTDVQQAFNQVGTNSASPPGGELLKRLETMRARMSGLSVQDIAAAERVEIEKYNAEQAASDAKNEQNQQREGNNASSAAVAGTKDPATTGMEALLGNLPPEAQALAPFFQNILDTITQGQQSNAIATNALLNGGTIDINGKPMQVKGINGTYDEIDQKLKDLENGWNAMQEGIQGMLDKAYDQQEEYISQQEKSEKERLAWNETQMLRQAANEKQAAVETRIARLALTGGFGSDGGLREIEETRASYEARMDDIKTEFGLQRTDLAAKFTGLYLEASNAHLTASITNIRETASALERIAGQSIASKQARQNAEQSTITNFLTQQTADRKEYANTLKEYAGQMVTMIHQDKEFKRLDQQQAWDQFKWLKSTYGTNIPAGALDSIKEKLPGVDVMALAKAQTADEIAKARKGSGGGGGGVSFASYQMKSNGQPPDFDDFLKQKETEALQSGAMSFDVSPTAMAAYRKEYDTKVNQAKALSPETLVARLEDRVKNITEKHVRENAESTVKKYLDEGRYADAQYYIDGLGKAPSQTERQSFSKAFTAKSQVQKISGLIENAGTIGPFIGRARSLDPYDDRIVELDNMIKQTVPGLARGIFGEVGVLTDSDIKNYTATMANPNLTLDQARTATRNLLSTIDTSIQSQIDVARASGLNVRDIDSIFVGDTSADPVPSSQADTDYVRSLNF